MASSDRIVLLLCHGTSHHKGTWAPIVRRLRAAALLQRVPCEILPIDWRYHGAKSTDRDPPSVYYHEGDEDEPRVSHPGRQWTEWAPEDLLKMTTLLRNEDKARGRKTHIVGIGHSLGAVALLKCEVDHPGTFAGLVLFEPTQTVGWGYEGPNIMAGTMVKRMLAGTDHWDTWEDVVNYYKTSRAFARLHPEGLEAFLDGGIKKTRDGRFRLALPLLQEAAFYCFQVVGYTEDQIASVVCPVVIEYGSESVFADKDTYKQMAALAPGRITLAEPLDGLSHFTVLENPELCATRILGTLEKLPIFQRAASKL